MMKIPLSVALKFSRTVENIQPLGNGLINDTYLVSTEAKPFVLQRINKRVFPQPEQIIDWAKQAGLVAAPSPVLDLPPWHYGIRFHRSAMPAR